MTEYSDGVFQDYTHYNKYYYKSKYDKEFKENKYYIEVNEDNIEELTNYIIAFGGWMKIAPDVYDFNIESINKVQENKMSYGLYNIWECVLKKNYCPFDVTLKN